MSTLILQVIQTVSIVFGVSWALFQYTKQNEFRRVQNLLSLWEKFYKDEINMEVFSILDNGDIAAIQNLEFKKKLYFLALLEMVSISAEQGEVDKKYASYKFQWHFYYVFQSELSTAFWENIGGSLEMKKEYWEISYKFSEVCKNKLNF